MCIRDRYMGIVQNLNQDTRSAAMETQFKGPKIDKYDENFQPTRAKIAHATGGIHLVDEENFRKVLTSIMKTLGKKIMEGSILDVMKISRPALISHHTTYLEACANDFMYYSQYVNLAAKERDPIKRMKLVMAATVGGMHYNTEICMNRAPVNPVIGETFQAVKPDGSVFFAEQISHHPPITAYLLIGPNNIYRMKGTGEIHAELTGMNSARGYRIGKSVIEFNDNTDIQISNPEIKVEGIVVGDRRLNYAKNTIFIDKANGLWGDIIYNLDESGKITKLAGKLKSWWKKETEEKLPSDYLTVKISKYEKLPDGGISKEPLSEGNGSWLEYLQIDGDVLWRINDERELWNAPEILLPSDSRLRDDLQLIKNRDFDKAQVQEIRQITQLLSFPLTQ
eukprot:TRINITY_DN1398_c0_g2_i5.p1 TRINITY_DN1398_c0_g2~~TRINITY_DN1398_c0_g2_i5.p1  ORF type:complete len:422 (-),score=77.03 TRINITY_DN1398_c0_g2_i5:390-1574(-)